MSGLRSPTLLGPKTGLDIRFFTAHELQVLLGDRFTAVMPLRLHSTRRTRPAEGRWSQWEGIWQRAGR
ncbi:hypothetical protein [Catellatospora sp. NPDC049133]|uniref:hypothetical protein n=1 Tax=Catellatospora sp. NPDC049133 TaxID=3155499 RepID=UPI0033DC92A1